MWCPSTQMVMVVMMGSGRHVAVRCPWLMVPRSAAAGGSSYEVVGVGRGSCRGTVLRVVVVLGKCPHHCSVGGNIDWVLVVSRASHGCGDSQEVPAATAAAGWSGVGITHGSRQPVRLEHAAAAAVTPSSEHNTELTKATVCTLAL
jgi:hypothetical protein